MLLPTEPSLQPHKDILLRIYLFIFLARASLHSPGWSHTCRNVPAFSWVLELKTQITTPRFLSFLKSESRLWSTGTHFAVHTALELTEIPVSASWMLRLKACASSTFVTFCFLDDSHSDWWRLSVVLIVICVRTYISCMSCHLHFFLRNVCIVHLSLFLIGYFRFFWFFFFVACFWISLL